MLFNSLEFLVFIFVFFPLYAILRGKILRFFMIVASYIFYGWANPWYCLLLFASTVLDYNIGRRITQTSDLQRRKLLLFASIMGNIGILGFFKYSGFFVQSINDIASLFNLQIGLVAPSIILPVGISFYTFQTLSYTIDVYRGKMDATDSFTSFALFVAFFPQLVAGPIERARDLLPQLQEKMPVSTEDVLLGVSRILWGLMKKVVFADNIAMYVNSVYQPSAYSNSNIEWVMATWLFAFQIYFDFSAYSDIAIGLARLMGIHINENFRHPYISRNVAEFWRRWHISLSTWLRDYLYFPLGGSRKGLSRTIFNVIIVFFLGGLWHGADVKFIVWGLWIGMAIGIYNIIASALKINHNSERPVAIRDLVGIIFTFQIIAISWVFFRADSMTQAMSIFESLLTTSTWTEVSRLTLANHYEIHRLLLFVSIVHLIRGAGLDRPLHRIRQPILIGIFWGILLAIMLVFHASTTERFIYFQF